MIIVKLTLNARKEKQDEIQQTLLAMIESMGEEKGCRNYHVFRSIKNKTIFNSYGEWDTREALYLYLKSDKFGVMLGTKSLLTKPMQIKILTVSLTEGIELINTIRSDSVLIASPIILKDDAVIV